VLKPLADAEPWHQVFFENRTDRTLRVFRLSSDGKNKYPSTVLAPGHGDIRQGKVGAVWVVEEDDGKCIGAYTASVAGKNEFVRIGEGDLLVPHGVPPNRLKVTVYPGFSVRPDREEVHVDSQDGVWATVCESLNLWVGVSFEDSKSSSPCGVAQESNKRINTGRQIVFDLTRPAVSGGTGLGVVRDRNADLHVFFSHEHERHTTRSVWELKPGERAESDRVELRFSVNGVPHNMLVGPWGPGEFNRSQIKMLHGNGSTKATVVRVSPTVWEVQSAENSLGRLWNNADKANPVDLGLYPISFRFRFELLPEKLE
jgi:hypothetical protein